jgi:hypothetical protein
MKESRFFNSVSFGINLGLITSGNLQLQEVEKLQRSGTG